MVSYEVAVAIVDQNEQVIFAELQRSGLEVIVITNSKAGCASI
ncbi:hypothetical protein D082_34010 [Synechocystis sp. PCC 6714]|nr:hypothetical protein D082_34010 [Synechocystis sp. PCC 6714]